MVIVFLAEDRPRPYLALGRRIAELRHYARLSQRELAHNAGYSEGYIPRIERGLNRPEPDVLRAIARALSADYDDLAVLAGYQRGTDEPQAPPSFADLQAQADALRPYEVLVYDELPTLHAGVGSAVAVQVVYLPAVSRRRGVIIGLKAVGDCMAEDIRDGEIAILDMEGTPLDGDIVAVETEDGGALRRYFIKNGGFELVADHPELADALKLFDGARMFPVIDVWRGKRPRRPNR